ncbi:MAG: MBG domain-containing protein, partial [Clostridia bacterium]|nr:MBG domain-containing protein [Clostridia bacterium]
MKKRLLPIIIILLTLVALMIGGCSSKEIPIERIALTSLPRLDYLKGETFDLNQAQLTVYYTNGISRTLPLTFEMVSDYDPQDIGEHMLFVKYENASTNIRIRITNAPIVRIEATKLQLDYKTQYIESQELDVTNLKLRIQYESGEPDVISVTEDMVSGYNPEVVGEQVLTISYLDNYTATYTVNVSAKKVTSIANAEVPDKELYLINERITNESLAGGRLFITFDNGYTEYKNFPDLFASQEALDAALDYDTSHEKSREIVTLNYADKAVIFAIKVLKKEAETFEILEMPSEFQIVGTDLLLRGGQLSISYNNLTTETVNMTDAKVSASGYDKTRVGIQTITLSFTDISKTFSFEIEVLETKPSSLEILLPVVEDGVITRYSQATEQDKVPAPFYEEGTIDLSMWEYRLKMDNNSYSAIYTVEPDMLKGDVGRLYLDEYGNRTYEFEYNRDETALTKAVEISIFKKELVRISVSPPTNSIFYARAELVLTGAKFSAFFNDGSVTNSDITRDMVSGFNNTQLGNQDVIVTYATEKYGSKMNSFKVLVIRKAESIQFENVFKTIYVLGEAFDLQGLVMRIHYEGYIQSDLFSGPFGQEWTFENTQFAELGHHNVVVKYQAVGLTLETTIPVYVKNELTDIELVEYVDGTYLSADRLPQVVAGMGIDFTNYYLACTLENGSRTVALEQIMTDYQRADKTPGDRTININYGGLSIQTQLHVVERQIFSLELLASPDKHYYKAAQPAQLDITGLRMKLSYTNETNILLNSSTLSQQTDENLIYRFVNEEYNYEYITLSVTPLNTTLAVGVETEVRTISISIEQFEVDFDIVVAYKIATSMTWDVSEEGQPEAPQPAVTALQGLDEVSFAPGASFKVVYNDGEFSETKTVEDEMPNLSIIGFNNNLKGTQVVDIRYQDIKLSTVVSVRPKELYSIALADGFTIPDVTEGMALDLRQAKLVVTYYHDMGTPDEGDDIVLPSTIISLSSGMTDYNKADGRLGVRPIIITLSYTGNRTVTKELNYQQMTVLKKQLDNIGMGMIPKTKYVELDQYDYTNGSIILYYNNNTTLVLPLSEAKRVRSTAMILPTDHYILNYGQFDNADFSGFSRKQQIFITYKEGDAVKEASYDIIMHDRMYAQVVFGEREEYNAELKTYYFWYGEAKTIQYQILGYSAHTDMPQNEMLAEMELEPGINYTFKYINEATAEEFSVWPKDAGTYKIAVVYDADSPVNNDRIHNSFVSDERKVVISPKNIHIAPNSLTKVYGENDPTFSSIISAVEYRDISGGGTEVILHTDNVFGYNDTAEALGEIDYFFPNNGNITDWKKAPVGNYVMNVSVAAHRNYAVTYAQAEFQITKRDIVIIADSKTKEYGQPDPSFTFTTAAVMGNDKSGLMQGDGFNGYLLRANESTSNGVGSYEIMQGSLRNDNYTIVYIPNYLTIYKRKLILTAKSYTKVYGESVPLFEVVPSSERETPFAYNDSVFSLGGNLSFECKDTQNNNIGAGTGVGTFEIIPAGYVSSNYDIEYVSGEIVITSRKVNVTATAKQKIYGTLGDPELTFTTSAVAGDTKSGMHASDTLNGALLRQEGEAVAVYAILQGTVDDDLNPNYEIIFVAGEFAITSRAAQIELTSLTRQYNGELPSVTSENIILHNAHGDIKSNIVITFINPSKNVGIYSIGFINNDTNHDLSFLAPEGYRFTVTQKEVSAEFYNIPYGNLEGGEYLGSAYKGSPYNYEARVPAAEICLGDTVNAVIYTAEIIDGSTPIYLDRTSVTNVGKYSVKVMSLTNANYKLRTPSAQELETAGDYKITEFRIIPAVIKVLVKTYAKTYTGGDISLNNSLTKIDGYYES